VAVVVLAIALVFAGIDAARRDPCKTIPPAWWLVLGMFLAVAAALLLFLRRNQERVAAGLAVLYAIPCIALALAAPAANVLDPRTHTFSPGIMAPLALVLFPVGLMLLGAGARAWVSLAPADWPGRLRGVLMVGGLLALGALVSMLGLKSPVRIFPFRAGGFNEGLTVSRLHAIHDAAQSYAATYHNGFPAGLAVLGEPAHGAPADCNAADLLYYSDSGESAGYRWVYVPGPPAEKAAAGCAALGVQSYTVVSRPKAYKETGTRSFITDESGAIRWTCEDRDATVQDAPIR
jgi:hypothetical protein